MEETTTTIKTSVFLKKKYQYLLALHFSQMALPDDYSHLRKFLACMLADHRFIDILNRELTKLEASLRKFYGDEKYEELKSQNLVYTKEMIMNAVGFNPSTKNFKKEYYTTDFITMKIKELDEKYLAKESSVEKKSFSPIIKAELQQIIKEINYNLPVINDCLDILFVCVIRYCDLFNVEVPREIITAPNKYRFDDKERDRRVPPNLDKYL